jgi:hypothetical protein
LPTYLIKLLAFFLENIRNETISGKYVISLERAFILTLLLEIRYENLGCSQEPFITLKTA